MTKRKIIVLSAIRNEDWILQPFLKATSLFADSIILFDQSQTSEVSKLVRIFPKIIYIRNETKELDENYRQEVLISAARSISSNAILIALDVDEFFTEKFFHREFQNKLHALTPGYGINFNMLNIFNDFQQAWEVKMNPIIYADNGAPFVHKKIIHNYRLPFEDKKILREEEVKVYHFQFLDWERMKSKHRWYQVMERILYEEKSAIEIFRLYNHMNSIPKRKKKNIARKDFTHYGNNQIDLTREVDYQTKSAYWWDAEVIKMFNNHRDVNFQKLDIWERNEFAGFKQKSKFIDKLVFSYLRKTQKLIHPSAFNILRYIVRLIDRIIGVFW